MTGLLLKQQPLPGLEYCTCLVNGYEVAKGLGCNLYLRFCRDAGVLHPFVPDSCNSCIWQRGCEADMCNPDGWGEPIQYPEHFQWRLENLTSGQKKQLTELGSDLMIITPDCLDQFYLEPLGDVYRCNRCLSVDIEWQAEWIACKKCGWSEPLHDYPVARRYE